MLPGPPAPHDMFEILGNGVFAFIMTLVEENNFPIPGLVNADGLPFLILYVNQITSDRIVLVFLHHHGSLLHSHLRHAAAYAGPGPGIYVLL